MAERKVVPFDEFYYQLKLMHYGRNTLYEASSSWLKFCRAFQGHLSIAALKIVQ
jgi:hypothetical protein